MAAADLHFNRQHVLPGDGSQLHVRVELRAISPHSTPSSYGMPYRILRCR